MASPSKLPSRRPLGNGLGGRNRPMSMFDMPTGYLKNSQQMDENGTTDESPDNSATSKQAKRRSLLPTFSRKVSGESKPADGKDGISVIREDTSDSEVSSRPSTRTENRPSTESSRSMMPPPKPTARTSSLRPPASATSTRTAASHTRTASKGLNGGPKRSSPPGSPQKTGEPGHKRTDSARLPQSRMTAPSTTSTQQAIPTRGSSVRASTSTLAQKRSSVIVPRPPALDTSVTLQGITQPSPTSPTRSSSRQSARTQMPLPSRPTFSTYQQHYSPAKSALPKPPVPISKTAKPTEPVQVEIVMTLENVLEQIDLLQLSLMHQGAAQIMREYQAHARHKLSKRHAKLRKDYESIRDRERDHRRAANLEALEVWCPDPALLTEHLQTLSVVVTDLRAHTDPGSRFSELTATFDKWAMKARSILLDNQPATFIEALPESWRSNHTSLALKLRSIQRSINTLPPAPPAFSETPSSLEIVLNNSSSLVDGMLKELEIMTKLQKEVLQRGKARIDEQINALVKTTDATRGVDKENWRPAWQTVT